MRIGIDIGGTNTKIGIVDKAGKVVCKTSIKTTDYPQIEDFINALYDVLQPLITQTGEAIEGIGIGVPNGNFHTGNIEHAANLVWKGIVPLSRLVSEKFGVPCRLTNDANAAAMGEMTYGVARNLRDFIEITLGTGLGSGIVIDGKVVYGHDGFAGELGHVKMVREGGRPCGCGQYGCLETYVSASGVANTARELLSANDTPSVLRSISPDKITSKDVFLAAEKDDEIATQVFAQTGKWLGEAFADFVAFSAPEAIILFGGLAKAGERLLQPIRQAMNENLMPIWKGKIKILLSELSDDDAGILGAASLIED